MFGSDADWVAAYQAPAICSDVRTHQGPNAISEHLDCLEWRLYLTLHGLQAEALGLATAASAAGRPADALRAELIASDARSRSGDVVEAHAQQLRLLERAAPWSDLVRRARMLLGVSSERLGERTESMRWIRSALDGWPDGLRPGWRAEALMCFALLAVSRTDVDYALVHHAISEVTSHSDPLMLSVTLANFAEVSAECGDLAISTEFADAAVALLRRHPEVAAALTLDSVAQSRLAVGELDAAEHNLTMAMRLEETLGCSDVAGDPWLTLSEVKFALGDPAAAWEHLEHPRRKAWAAKTTWMRSRDLKLRAQILAAMGEWRRAYQMLTDHLDDYEKLRSVEGDRALAENETQLLADEERRRAAEFELLALTDPLTGLANRRRVDRWLHDVAGSGDEKSPISVAIIDLDNFKRINDQYSHDTGDEVLRRVAAVLRDKYPDTVGGRRLAARLGGEEFVLLWSELAAEVASGEARALLLTLRAACYDDIAPGLRVTASIGLASGHAAGAGPALMKSADLCLYEAKRSGRNRLIVAEDITH